MKFKVRIKSQEKERMARRMPIFWLIAGICFIIGGLAFIIGIGEGMIWKAWGGFELLLGLVFIYGSQNVEYIKEY